jgi:hypothetical protein
MGPDEISRTMPIRIFLRGCWARANRQGNELAATAAAALLTRLRRLIEIDIAYLH